MAARLNPRHQESVREKIRAGEYIRMLGEHISGNREMSSTQVGAAQFLINQSIGSPPQMTDVNFAGKLETNDISEKPLTPQEWADQANSVGTDARAAEPTDQLPAA